MENEMTNVEVVEAVLKRSGCQTSRQIAMSAKRWFNVSITPTTVGGALRSLASKDRVCSSNCGNGQSVYWLKENNYEKSN